MFNRSSSNIFVTYVFLSLAFRFVFCLMSICALILQRLAMCHCEKWKSCRIRRPKKERSNEFRSLRVPDISFFNFQQPHKIYSFSSEKFDCARLSKHIQLLVYFLSFNALLYCKFSLKDTKRNIANVTVSFFSDKDAVENG